MIEKTKRSNSLGSLYKKFGVYLILIIEVLVFACAAPNFRTVDNIMTIGRQVSTIGVAAVGATFLMICGGIDISNGSVQAFTGVIVAMMMVNAGMPIWLSIILSLIISSLFGIINGIAYAKFRISPLITTLATQTIVKGISFLITDATPIYGLDPAFKAIGQGNVFGIVPICLIIMIVCFIFGWWVLNRTYVGRYFYATGGNSEASRLSGINVSRVFILASVASTFFASISGVIMAARLGSGQPNIASSLPMDVITGIVLGGVSINGGSGKVGSVLVGVLVMGILANGMIIIGLNDYWQWVVDGLVLLFAVAMSNISIKTE